MSEENPRPVVHGVLQDASETGHVVTGWACVVETMAPDGRRWLSRLTSDASGDRRLPRWTEQGLIFNALHGNCDDDWNLSDSGSEEA